VDENGLGPFEPVEAIPGDVVFLSTLVPHRSGPNVSHQPRRAIFYTYAADAEEGIYSRYRELKKALPHRPR
jgi:hypothetical protein